MKQTWIEIKCERERESQREEVTGKDRHKVNKKRGNQESERQR